jgi:tetratricopeptide (TPR) repeat protein
VAVPDGVAPSQAFKQWLGGQQAPWLLIFDNADDPQALRRQLPSSGPHHVIITSRRPGWGGLAKTMEMSTWTPEQGADFVMQRLGLGDNIRGDARSDGHASGRADAEALSLALGGLPLALEQAASYIEVNGGTVAQYLVLWRTAAAELLNKHSTNTGYELAVGVTLSLAFKHLSPAALQLLRLCSFAAPEPLPERFFTEGHAGLPGELGVAAAKPVAWNEVAGELRRYGLLQRRPISRLDRAWEAGGQTGEGATTELELTIHRLTQQVARDQLAEAKQDSAALLSLLARALPSDRENTHRWHRLAALLPHALWLNDTDLVLDEPGSESSNERVCLLEAAAGFLLFSLGLYPQACRRMEQALALRREHWGEEHPATLIAMGNLGSALQMTGDFARARPLQEQTLSVHRRVLGEAHPDTLTSMSNFADTLRQLGDLAQAQYLQEAELEIRKQVFGDAHPSTLTCMANLALTLRAQANLGPARALQKQVLAATIRVLGADHPAALSSMTDLASTLHMLGELESAQALQERASAFHVKVLGPEHPRTLLSINSLAEILNARGNCAAGKIRLEQLLPVCRRVLGGEHTGTLTVMGNLASTLVVEGNFAGARSLQGQVLAVCRRVLGEEHPDTLTAMHNMAVSLWNLGERKDAAALMTLAANGRAHKLGAAHPLTQDSRAWLADWRARRD